MTARLGNLCAELGIEEIALVDSMQGVGPIRQRYDGPWSDNGHRAAARVLEPQLERLLEATASPVEDMGFAPVTDEHWLHG
jgi:hypothetical protein